MITPCPTFILFNSAQTRQIRSLETLDLCCFTDWSRVRIKYCNTRLLHYACQKIYKYFSPTILKQQYFCVWNPNDLYVYQDSAIFIRKNKDKSGRKKRKTWNFYPECIQFCCFWILCLSDIWQYEKYTLWKSVKIRQKWLKKVFENEFCYFYYFLSGFYLHLSAKPPVESFSALPGIGWYVPGDVFPSKVC